MWKRIFQWQEHNILSEQNTSKTPYTSLPPISYDWIFRSSSISTPQEEMPPFIDNYPVADYFSYMEEQNCDVNTKLKCVFIGDGAVGKTSLIVSYTTNGYPAEYIPTAFDNYNVVVNVDNKPIRLQLCDTAGQDDFDSLRPLCYPESDVFIVCFSVVSPTSFHNVKDKWLPELKLHNSTAPVLLVGTQSDLKTDVKVLIELAQYGEQPVSESTAKKFAQQIGAVSYVESSALTQKNLKEVFDQAIVAGMQPKLCDSQRAPRPFSLRASIKYRTVTQVFSGKGSGSPTTGTSTAAQVEQRKSGWRRFCCFSS